MLNRRGFAACAICSAIGLVATGLESKARAEGLKRTVIRKQDFPGDQYATILMQVDIEPGFFVPWHTHPGVESTFVVDGDLTLKIKGQPDRGLKSGEGFEIPPETPHAAEAGDRKVKLAITYVVDKNKPLATLVPAPA